jgi:hypothetical protein
MRAENEIKVEYTRLSSKIFLYHVQSSRNMALMKFHTMGIRIRVFHDFNNAKIGGYFGLLGNIIYCSIRKKILG